MKYALYVNTTDIQAPETRPNAFVAEFDTIPPFVTDRPDVLVWGSRTFVDYEADDEHGRAMYIEAFAYHIVTAPTDART